MALNLKLPSIKSSFFISSEDVTNEPVLTTPDCDMTTPLGLMRNTFPFEFNDPAIVEGVDPVTRFNEVEDDEGI